MAVLQPYPVSWLDGDAPVEIPVDLVFFTRQGCHLCEVGKRTVEDTLGTISPGPLPDWRVRVVDIDVAGGQALADYSQHVPVLRIFGDTVLTVPWTANDVRHALTTHPEWQQRADVDTTRMEQS